MSLTKSMGFMCMSSQTFSLMKSVSNLYSISVRYNLFSIKSGLPQGMAVYENDCCAGP